MEKNNENKKSNLGKKVLKTILIILLIAFLCVLVHTTKNYIIISGLQDKVVEYKNSTNYYTKVILNERSGVTITSEYYIKDNKEVVFIERNFNGEKTKLSFYKNAEKINTYIETKDTKTAQLNKSVILVDKIYNNLETDNKWQTFIGSITSTVRTEKINGKDCYFIKGFMSSSALNFDKQKVYIEKDTGLLVKVNGDELETNREYEFNNIDDSIFEEPDISQFTIKDNN